MAQIDPERLLEDNHELTYFEMGGILSVIHDDKFYVPHKSFKIGARTRPR